MPWDGSWWEEEKENTLKNNMALDGIERKTKAMWPSLERATQTAVYSHLWNMSGVKKIKDEGGKTYGLGNSTTCVHAFQKCVKSYQSALLVSLSFTSSKSFHCALPACQGLYFPLRYHHVCCCCWHGSSNCRWLETGGAKWQLEWESHWTDKINPKTTWVAIIITIPIIFFLICILAVDHGFFHPPVDWSSLRLLIKQ